MIALLLWMLASPSSGQVRVGRAAVEITPPPGIPMAGYYSVRLAGGEHDPLFAKAIVMEGGGVKAALVACDLIGVERLTVEQARKLIETRVGIPGVNVMISATHSHTGPLMRGRFLDAVEGEPRRIAEGYIRELPGKIADAVHRANDDLAPALARSGAGREDSLSFNRRFYMKDGTVRFNPGKLNPNIVRPAGGIDPEVPVVLMEAPDGSALATYVNFALHLDTVGGVEFSADYPATVSRLLSAVKGPRMLTMFTIGTAGNINHIDVASRDPQKGHGEAERIGTVLAGEVLKTYTRLAEANASLLQARSEIVKLPVLRYAPDEVEKARRLAARMNATPQPPFLDMVHALKVLDAEALDGALPAEVQAIALGPDLAWVGLPGEIFVELGTAIKKASPFRRTIVVELANGSISYVPDRKGFAEGAYEATSARCAPGGGELLVAAAVRMLEALHATASQ